MSFALISYDITDNRRRSQIAKYLLDFGQRVQYSVFEVSENEETLENIFVHLQTIIDPKADSLRMYRICRSCRQETAFAGKERRYELDDSYFIV